MNLQEQNEQLQKQVTSLTFALSMADQKLIEKTIRDSENVAAENVHLLARLGQLNDPNLCDLIVELRAMATTERLINTVQIRGYYHAVEQLSTFARTCVDHVLYDVLMDLVRQMRADAVRAGYAHG